VQCGWLILLCLLLCAPSARAEALKIATWNLNWLTTRDRVLPSDMHARQPEDFDRLRAYAGELAADVVAVQEVDGGPTALRLFPVDRYSVHMARDPVAQRVGIVVRRGLRYDVNPDVKALALDPAEHLRSGADITLRLPGGGLRLLAVHLKRGCSFQPLRRPSGSACVALAQQVPVLRDWIAARVAEGVPFLVLGDFNREMDQRDTVMPDLRGAGPVLRATEGHASPCWGRDTFIDHILLGGPAREWLQPGSLRVLVYRETDPAWKDRLSDHCPVSVRLTPPGSFRMEAPDVLDR
jgi:endonuclease/exonuclease/phosphatase family metal-dependent hydrolase